VRPIQPKILVCQCLLKFSYAEWNGIFQHGRPISNYSRLGTFPAHKVLKYDEVAFVSAGTCFMRRNLTRIHKTINIPEIFSDVHGFTWKTFTGSSRLSVHSHVVVGANERLLYSQTSKDLKTSISKTHAHSAIKCKNPTPSLIIG